MMAAFIMPATVHAHGRAETVRGQVELMQVFAALQRYKMDKGSFPDSLDALWSGDNPYMQGNVSFPREAAKYRPDAGPQEPLVAFPSPDGRTWNVLFGDGHVEITPADRYREFGPDTAPASPEKVEKAKPKAKAKVKVLR
jgi:prepilin-type processing-associated H-X9-DG protein